MKSRADFVTNSSSSSFICLRVDDPNRELIILANNTTEDKLLEEAYDYGLEAIDLRGKNLQAVAAEDYLAFVGRKLTEADLESKTLAQLKAEFVADLNEEYGLGLTVDNIEFDYGEIWR